MYVRQRTNSQTLAEIMLLTRDPVRFMWLCTFRTVLLLLYQYLANLFCKLMISSMKTSLTTTTISFTIPYEVMVVAAAIASATCDAVIHIIVKATKPHNILSRFYALQVIW